MPFSVSAIEPLTTAEGSNSPSASQVRAIRPTAKAITASATATLAEGVGLAGTCVGDGVFNTPILASIV
jgi:hypothetical protein